MFSQHPEPQGVANNREEHGGIQPLQPSQKITQKIKWVTKRGALLVVWAKFKPLAIKGGTVFTPKVNLPPGGLRLPSIPKVHALQGGGPGAPSRYVAGLTWCGIEKRLSWSRFAYTDDEPTCKTCIRAMESFARRKEK